MNKKGKIIGLSLAAIMVVSLFAVAIPSVAATFDGDKPDLVITNIWINADRIHYTIQNIGDAAAPTSYTGLWIDGHYSARDRVGPLAPDEESDEVFEREQYKGGEIRVCADYQDRIDELNDENNCREGMPNLVVEKSVIFDVCTFTVDYTVTNTGNCQAGASTTCKYFDGVHIVAADQLCPALAPGESHSGTFGPEPCPCGATINVTICADNYDVVAESDETDNCEINWEVCGMSDLEVTVTFNDGSFTADYTITNTGVGPAGPSTTCMYVDGVHLVAKDQLCPVLAPGASHSGTFGPEPCPCGQTLNVTICADNYDVVAESDETDNCAVNFVDCPPGIPGIEVNKTVWHPCGGWVDEITASFCDIVRFRCEIHNSGTCCPLTDIVVTDILSDSLEYADSATVDGVPQEPDWIVGNSFGWDFPGPLNPCETITIEFDAHVVGCGVDNNTQRAEATGCEGQEVWDEDTATVNVPQTPGIEVNKTVWDPETGEWVDEITACVCDNVRFRCEIHNDGSCCPLTDIMVTDILSDSLEYADSATVDGVPQEPDWIAGNSFGWNFTGPLDPCETITIEFDAHVIECGVEGVDINTQKAEATGCEEQYVWDEDTATVRGKPDLVVNKSVTFEDGTFIVNYNVTNEGCGPAGESETCKFVNGELQECQTCPALASGASYNGVFDPEPCPPCGETLIVTVYADYNEVVDECNETNNCDVNVVECPEMPDLVVDKSVTVEDGTFTVSYTVTNIGCAQAGASNTTIYVDGANVLEDPVPALGSGRWFLNTVGPFDCPSGAILNVTVCADNGNVVDESNETNNCEINEVVCGMPDLEVQKRVENVDGTFIVHYTVTNTGDGPAGASTTCKYVDGLHIVAADQLCPPLAPGASYIGTFGPEDCPCGTTINVTICADNYNVVVESDETNNCEVNWVDCPPCKPDLVITEIWVVGNRIHYTIENQGGADAPRSYTGLWIDGHYSARDRVDPLAPGEESDEVFARENYKGGDIEVCADYQERIEEANENNNCMEEGNNY